MLSSLDLLQNISHASALADMATSLYLGSVKNTTDPADFVEAWGAYVDADKTIRAWSSRANAAGAPPLQNAVIEAWKQLDDSIVVTNSTNRLRSGALVGVRPTVDDFTTLSIGGAERDRLMGEALQMAVVNANDATRTQASTAQRQLRELYGFGGAIIVISLALTWFVRRAIARPLGKLARQSRTIAAGELVDIAAAGPREVQTVAHGLAATVGSLRLVQHQAEAIATGDLESDVLSTPAPGALGDAMHASVTRMVDWLHERNRFQQELAHEATHDALTQLPNRAHTLTLTSQALHRAARTGTRVGLLFVDLDHFKAVNDRHGHAAGDELLRVVSQRMHETVRAGDAVCRLGGDEFVILLEGVEDEKGIVDLGRRLIAAVSEPVALGDSPQAVRVRVGASVGVAISSKLNEDAEGLLHNADTAAYRAKNAGRGVVEVFGDELRAELAARADLESALREAITTGGLELHYQPVLDLSTGRTHSVEALVRWRRQDGVLLPPAAFIPVAEMSSLICDLGRWALREATAQLLRWDTEGGARAGLRVAVNISGRHLAQAHLLEDVVDALAASGIDPHRLTIEITETVLIDQASALEHLRSIRELGVRVAIDDFGTGYTSIGQLSNLPADVLKIDRSLVASPDLRHADLVRLLITAAHSFDLEVIAEGVEEDTQLSTLTAADCDAAQGFLFARPAPAASLTSPGNALVSTAPVADVLSAGSVRT